MWLAATVLDRADLESRFSTIVNHPLFYLVCINIFMAFCKEHHDFQVFHCLNKF